MRSRFFGTAIRNDIIGNGIAVDSNNNVVITGIFHGNSLVFDGIPDIQNYQKTGCDFFVVKFSPNGIPLWSRSGGGTGWDIGHAVSIDRRYTYQFMGESAGLYYIKLETDVEILFTKLIKTK